MTQYKLRVGDIVSSNEFEGRAKVKQIDNERAYVRLNDMTLRILLSKLTLENRLCAKCHIYKDVSEFPKHSGNKLKQICKACNNRIISDGKRFKETVNRPEHYIGAEGLEVETILRQFIPFYQNAYIGHRIGSAVEYILRAPRKNGLEDLRKARRNLDQAIEAWENDTSL